jgi:uncharacterized protein involved in propanediol utilization
MRDTDLKTLAEKATPGPWVAKGHQITDLETASDKRRSVAHTVAYLTLSEPSTTHRNCIGEADAAYIVAACNETPKLLARIAALRAVLSHLPVHADYSGAVLNGLISDALAADDKAQGESSLWVCQTPKNR